MENKNVLITGGSGLVGQRLSEILIEKGYSVSHLSRKEDLTGPIKKYRWDPESGLFDTNCLKNIDHIIHLAGAGVADKRWTESRKKEILASRIDSTKLLLANLEKTNNNVKSVVSASAIGYYGFYENEKLFTEKDNAGTDFLATVTKAWENESGKFSAIGIRTVRLRIGVVLSEKGGALPQMVNPIKYFAGMAIGSGQQIISWIALDDLCNLFIYSIENESIKGIYNAVAPNPISNNEFTKMIGKVLKRPIWPINLPEFLLEILLGEMANIVTKGSAVSNHRIANETDFRYKFTSLEPCLKALYNIS